MGQALTSKLKLTMPGVMQHYCLGCNGRHNVHIGIPNQNNAQWSYNGNHESPTFSPSVHISYNVFNGTDEEELEYERRKDLGENIVAPMKRYTQCHYFITDGKIIYCGDSDHKYAGMTLDLPDFPEDVNF